MERNTGFDQHQSRLATLLLYGGAAAAVFGLHLATNGTLGFHTDELYYLDCGRHPALGYVDFPPIVPLLARIETGLFGVTPWALRLLPALLSGLLVALSGAYVRRLGGSLWLQGIALVSGIAAPLLVGTGDVFQTVIFDVAAWMVALYWFLCVVIDRKPRYWIYLGITLGIGLEVKYTIVGLIAGIAIAVLLTPSLRNQLRTRYPWIAAAIALLIWAPNLAWQVVNGFPSLVYIANHRGSGGGVGIYLIELALIVGLLLPLWVAGIISIFRSPLLHPIGIASAVPLVLFLFVGKSYYAASTIPVVMAQGLIALSRIGRPRLRTTLRIAVVAASALSFVALAKLTLPITPASQLHATGLDKQNEVFADSVGWDDVASQVTAIYRNLPASERTNTVIISAYYGVPRGPAGLWQSQHPPRRCESAAKRLLLAAAQPHGDERPHGRLHTIRRRLDVRIPRAHRPPHRSLPGRGSRAGRPGDLLPAQGTARQDLGPASQLFLIRLTANGLLGRGQPAPTNSNV